VSGSLENLPAGGDWIDAFILRERLPLRYRSTIDSVLRPLAARIAEFTRESGTVPCIGLCGAQGSGKSTASAALGELLQEAGLPAAVLSIDDFYLTRAERERLAAEVHPLLVTRGVPGTHDVALACQVIAALRAGERPLLPRFDKGRDDRLPAQEWQRPAAPVRVVLLEGWCVGARPEPAAALPEPINELERREDPRGVWRRYVNDALAGPYRELFDPLRPLVLLRAPSFDVVYHWRLEQERKLRQRVAREGGDGSRVMDDAGVARFISHYERVTRRILEEMPQRADVVLAMDADRAVV
jgi:D-glycerate 3-kinase